MGALASVGRNSYREVDLMEVMVAMVEMLFLLEQAR